MSPLTLNTFDFDAKGSLSGPKWILRDNIFLWYLSCKLVYIVNIILQILIFEKMLRVDIFSYYSRFVKNLFVDVPEDAEMEVFPLLTYCEFPGEPQLHSYLLNFGVLCTLPINIYNEGVFHLLMTLYIVLFILLLFTIGRWALQVSFLPREDYFGRRLRWSRPTETFSDIQLKALASNFNVDAFFILRLIENNCGVSAAAQILDFMFKVQNNQSDIADN